MTRSAHPIIWISIHDRYLSVSFSNNIVNNRYINIYRYRHCHIPYYLVLTKSVFDETADETNDECLGCCLRFIVNDFFSGI